MFELREQLIALLFVVLGMLIIPLVMIALDYWAGIRKAKKRGDPIRSDKMKRTVDKVSRYYNGIFALMVLDVMQISGFVFLHLYNQWDAYTFPVFTFAAVGFDPSRLRTTDYTLFSENVTEPFQDITIRGEAEPLTF